jgi:1,4-alpha-glucan branching enzyme
MGEEWAAHEPFPFFCDFEGELAAQVAGRRRGEFARFDRFRDEVARLLIPDPGAETTFESARLDWRSQARPGHGLWLALYRSLLHIRAREIAPRLAGMSGGAHFTVTAGALLSVDWTLGDGCVLHLLANLGPDAHEHVPLQNGRVLYASAPDPGPALSSRALPPWAVAWTLEPRNA